MVVLLVDEMDLRKVAEKAWRKVALLVVLRVVWMVAMLDGCMVVCLECALVHKKAKKWAELTGHRKVARWAVPVVACLVEQLV